MKVKRTPWTKQQVDEFRDWHEARLQSCGYDGPVLLELRRAREKWISTVKTTSAPATDEESK